MVEDNTPKRIENIRRCSQRRLSPSSDSFQEIIDEIDHFKRTLEIRRGELEENFKNLYKYHTNFQQVTPQKQKIQGRSPTRRPNNAKLRQSQKELRTFAQSMIYRMESDRRRISLQLHNNLAQGLAAIKLFLETKLSQLSKEDMPGSFSIEAILGITQENLNEVRRLINYLRPRMLDDLGLLATIRWYRQEFLQHHPDIALAIHLNATEMDIPASLKLPIYRVFQEAVDNSAGHGHLVNHIDFRLTRQLQTVQLEICADGYDKPAPVPPEQGLNPLILGVKCYTELSGGRFNLRSASSRGSWIEATWDIEKQKIF